MKFCSSCGGSIQLIVPADDHRARHVCRACGTVFYENPKVVVGTLPLFEGRILLCRRNIEPRKGLWTLPAGFLETGESTAEGAARETLEETGARVIELAPYLMVDIVHIHQIYLMYRARLPQPVFHPTAESAEVKLVSPDQIPWEAIAFPVVAKTLHFYLADLGEGRFPFRTDRIDPLPPGPA